MDCADTPDVRNRYTRDTARQLVKDALDGVVSNSKRWLSEGLPSADQVQQRFVAVAAALEESMDVLGKRKAKMDAEDAEAAADQHGAILIHRDPCVSDVPIFEKLCSFSEEENTRYGQAYDRLRRMIDSELLEHISESATGIACCSTMFSPIEMRRIGQFEALAATAVDVDSDDDPETIRQQLRAAHRVVAEGRRAKTPAH